MNVNHAAGEWGQSGEMKSWVITWKQRESSSQYAFFRSLKFGMESGQPDIGSHEMFEAILGRPDVFQNHYRFFKKEIHIQVLILEICL